MRHIFYDCDKCFHSSTARPTAPDAKRQAMKEGFKFIRGENDTKHYCPKCASPKKGKR